MVDPIGEIPEHESTVLSWKAVLEVPYAVRALHTNVTYDKVAGSWTQARDPALEGRTTDAKVVAPWQF